MYMYINIMNELNDELDGEVLNYVVELTNGRTEDPQRGIICQT
jgi:hypothetical protein